jgi:hypothetical protein
MTATLIVVAAVCISLLAALVIIIDRHEEERETWTVERKQLVDRVIARHTGEVLALDREPKPKPNHDEPPVYVEGLS